MQENKKAEEANEAKPESKEDSIKESTEVQEQAADIKNESETSVSPAEEVAKADSDQTVETTEKDNISTPSEDPSTNVSEACEVVNLEDGDSQSSAVPQEGAGNDEKKEELETIQTAPVEEQKDNQGIEEISEVTENNDKENTLSSSDNACSASSGQDLEIIPQNNDVQDVTVANTEVSICVKTKTDDDVEVLEVELVKNVENSLEPPPAPVSEASGISSQPAPEEVFIWIIYNHI